VVCQVGVARNPQIYIKTSQNVSNHFSTSHMTSNYAPVVWQVGVARDPTLNLKTSHNLS
jgi:hypothetical protein